MGAKKAMKSLHLAIIVIMVMASLCFTPAAKANTISSGSWVELLSYNSIDNAGIMTYGVSNSKGGPILFTYDTFCIQDNVNITPSKWYAVADVSNTVGYFNQTIAGAGPLNDAVDYLFYRFDSGAYGSLSLTQQADLQRLIWSLQGSGPSYTSSATPWAIDLANYNNPSNGLQHPWGTMVINIVTNYSSGRFVGPDVQNQLYNQVPEPTTMLLLGFGLMGVTGIRRKLHN